MLVGTLEAKDEFIFGRLKLGMFKPETGVEVPAAAGFLTENGEEAVFLPPKELVLGAASDNPVAITVILA